MGRSRVGSKIKTTLLFFMIPAGFLVAVNLFWLEFSTTRVSIEGHGLADVKIHINDEVIELGDLRRSETRFMFLPKVGTATYWITYSDEDNTQIVCQLEIREKGQHVEAHLYGVDRASCSITEPMFSELMVAKFF